MPLHPLGAEFDELLSFAANLNVAIVHEWLIDYSGSERVVEQFLNLFPQADLFAVVENLPPELKGFIQHKPVTTTFIQKLPWGPKKYQRYLPLMPMAIEQLDLSDYDLILSSAHAVAKGVITGPTQCHISYVHSPMRYAWDLQHQYLRESGLERGPKSWLARYFLHNLRQWDRQSAMGVDFFAANSRFIASRIAKVYRRRSQVIYPPVDVSGFEPNYGSREDYYLAACRVVPYKRMELIVEAFNRMPQRRLVAIGGGPGLKKLQQMAGPNVEVLGYQPFSELKRYMQQAKAFVFAAQEDFGITVVEAQACGTPVIAYGTGGALETVNVGNDGEKRGDRTGVLFSTQAIEHLIAAVDEFERLPPIPPQVCRENSMKFDTTRFCREFSRFTRDCWQQFNQEELG